MRSWFAISRVVARFTGERTVHAVNDLSLSLGEGEVLGLLGESGSGKSVTCLAMTGLVPTPGGRVATGSVMLDGQELVGLEQRLDSAAEFGVVAALASQVDGPLRRTGQVRRGQEQGFRSGGIDGRG